MVQVHADALLVTTSPTAAKLYLILHLQTFSKTASRYTYLPHGSLGLHESA